MPPSLPALDFSLLRSARVPARALAETDLRGLAAFVLGAERVAGPVALTLEVTGHSRIHALNRRFRGVDRTTDVISFRNDSPIAQAPQSRRARASTKKASVRPWGLDAGLCGDIAINVAQAGTQAQKMRHSLARELRLLWIHGILHLLGYTDYDPLPRRRMFRRQNQLLRRWEQRAGKK